MGYMTFAYGVDLDRLAAVKGSGDNPLLAELDREFGDELAEVDPNDSISLREALTRIIGGNTDSVVNGNHQYGYALELLCRHLGEALDGEGHIRYLEDLCWDIRPDASRTPIELPAIPDFPDVRSLDADEVKAEYARFENEDTEDDDPEVTDAREEYVWWLKQCVDTGVGLVMFCY